MILFAIGHSKKIAFLFFIIFYSNFLLSARAFYKYNRALIYNYHSIIIHKDLSGSYNPILVNAKRNVITSKHDHRSELKGTYKNLEIGGPGQPETNTFQSVNASNMVDLFTGDMAYTIPLLDVGGYPISIHYTSGITIDQEASWVGLGWNINPGAITRNMRGIPDDFDGSDLITKTHNIKTNKTVGVTIQPGVEVFGDPVDFSATLGVFHNNYQGFGVETGIGIGSTAKTSFGSLTGNLSISNNSQTGLHINPSLNVAFGNSDAEKNLRGSLGISTGYSSRLGLSSLQFHGGIRTDENISSSLQHVSTLSYNFPVATISFAVPSYNPSITMPLTNESFSFTGKLGVVSNGVDPNIAITGYVNKQYISDEDTIQQMPAIGYLYSNKANGSDNILLDYNREKELEFNYNTTPHIAIPQYTYDAFNISGEGIGGSFRAYRGDVGYVFDHTVSNKSKSSNSSLDIGFLGYLHTGLEVTDIKSNSQNHRWNSDNEIEKFIRFKNRVTNFEPVYFRNPGEKTTNSNLYQKAIGDDALMRISLTGDGDNITASNNFILYKNGVKTDNLPVKEPIVKNERDKRTQLITYLTAKEASIFGLDKQLTSYPENSFPSGSCPDGSKVIERITTALRKQNHLSEISVLNNDGRKYVYGLPVYNALQQDVTFAINKETDQNNIEKGLVSYDPLNKDNTTQNSRCKDHYFLKEETPSYAHSFLLTGILSSDYVDITGDGITPDDRGDAIKFNYTQLYGSNEKFYDWRSPSQLNKANYNEGLKSYDRDDKANYSYGKKEIWYLNSVESKNMIAVFTISSRQDAFAAIDENGGYNPQKGLRKLDKIDLYSKADVLKNGYLKAKPIKTVHFSYSYTLCKGTIENNPSIGKLTLESLWFSYNGNENSRKHPYFFKYNAGTNNEPSTIFNPSYNSKKYDRWGTFKDPACNPGQLTNADYPYTVQDSVLAGQYAQAWTLTDIDLPSGGKMKITYEADDYAYVQNKRATSMVSVAGIQTAGGNKLYNNLEEFSKFYINTPTDIIDKSDLLNKYLDINQVVYYKLAVLMPTSRYGTGYEFVPGYGKILDYGLVPGNSKQFWVTLYPVENQSPFVRSALQFLRLNLPSKAYPASELGDDIDLKDAIQMLASSITEIRNVVNGFNAESKSKGWCNSIDLSKSIVRLSCPGYKKYGGGIRVKSIKMFDNWNTMTNQLQQESVYGQEYNYTTSEDVNGKKIIISSGVATYEPSIGAEENPWRTPVSYMEQLAPMAPKNYLFSEEPIGETFFQAPTVGYSKVRVRTINTKTKSANGWDETEYFTSRDFPSISEHTLLDDESKKKYETMSGFLTFNHKNHVTLSQGFKIELNDMNGKIKKQSTYSEIDSVNPIKYTLNYYKTDDDQADQKHLNNNVWVAKDASGKIATNGIIGKDIELMVDLREQHSYSQTQDFSPNVDFINGLIIPFPIPTWFHFPQSEDTRFRSAAVVKVIHKYGILDSVVVMDKGSIVSTKNIVYDAETGNVLLSRTNNEFNDPIYNFNYPAYWAYDGMGPAYKNINTVISSKDPLSFSGGLKLIAGKLYNEQDTSAFPVEKYFQSGDEVFIDNASAAFINPLFCKLLIAKHRIQPTKLWVIDAAKGLEGHTGLYFIDENGKTPTLLIKNMKIIRSGRRNMLDATVGAVSMLNNPLVLQNDLTYKITIDKNSKVLNSHASSFSDLWKVDNSSYQADSCFTTFIKGGDRLYPEVFLIKNKFRPGKFKLDTDSVLTGKPYSVASFNYSPYYGGHNSLELKTKALFKFNFATIPKGAVITNAFLYQSATLPKDLWKQELKSYDWNSATDFYSPNKPKVTYKRVTSSWDINTKYNDFNVSDINSSSIIGQGPSYYFNIPVTQLAQDMLSNNQPEIMMELDDYSHTGNVAFVKYLSFYESGEHTYAKSFPTDLTLEYNYPVQKCVKVCRPNIIPDNTNPYKWGILGCWRMDKSYSYYHNRKESDASTSISNIRTEGTLDNFSPYWNFTETSLQSIDDPSKWVWNSTSSAFNKRGYEIENHDPLGRYNAGIYGYDQTLPIAIVQNSKYRESVFDGFEDYDYKSNNCINCIPKREIDFISDNQGVSISNLQSHTGLSSLHINANTEAKLVVPINDLKDTSQASISMRIDSAKVNGPYVVGTGTGLDANYFTTKWFFARFCDFAMNPILQKIDPLIDFHWMNNNPPVKYNCANSYRIKWNGKIQPRFSEGYKFYFKYTGSIQVTIKSPQNVIIGSLPTNNSNVENTATLDISSITLNAGELYTISIDYIKSNANDGGEIQMMWESNSETKKIVPQKFLYPYPYNATGSIIQKLKYYCVTANPVKPIDVIKSTFSPVAGNAITISAWIRIAGPDCNAIPASQNSILVNFKNNSNDFWLEKTGVRIEGWQRYEANINVPGGAKEMQLHLRDKNNQEIFVDDIRIHPYNSNMKSYVYNPVNLRLMADLDENNYASFYEYDDDGTLIRVKKETERGIMTIKETRTALIKNK